MKKLITLLSTLFFLSCFNNNLPKIITIDANPDFFTSRKRELDGSNIDYFEYNFNEKEVYLTPNQEKDLGITSFREYPNLDSLKIRKTNSTMKSKAIYQIEEVILEK